ncbi:MAG: PIG-L family deacetylase [Nitrospirae bacterium]|nr:PIG-L family deacetylase [Nitrospirota bacterium]
MKKVLIIAPHMDDETLGCGGTICRRVKAGDKVCVFFIAHRVYNHVFDERRNNIEKAHALKAKNALGYSDTLFLNLPDERLDACIQDIIIPLEKGFFDLKPDVVYVPFSGDNNQDHRAVFDAARVVLRPAATPFVKEIYMYETPSSTEQSPPLPENAFLPNYYVNIKNTIGKKIKALGCYETEGRKYPHPRSAEAVKIAAQKRGIEAGFEYAEAFVMLRGKWS